ncbi:ap2 domain transcription factor ap2xii-4, partial [Cystoisospora suis]
LPSKVRDAVTGRVAVCAYDAVKKERVKKVQLFEKEGEGATWCVRFGKNDECIRCFPIEKYGSAKALWYAIRFRQRVTGHPLGDGIGSRLLSPHESPERKEQEKDSQREQLLSPSSLSRSNSSPRRRLLQSSPVSNGKDGGVSSYSAHKAKEGKEEEKRDIVDKEQRGEEEKEEEGQEVRGKDVDGEKDEVTGKEMEVDEKTQTTDKRGGEEEQEEKRGWVSGLREGSSFVETKEEERREGGVVNERDGEKEGDRTQETLHDVEEMKGLQEKDLHSLEKTTLEIAYTQHAGEGESRGRMGEAKEREDILPSRQVIIPENGKEEGSSLDKKTESVDDIETSHRVGREETSSMRMGEGESITSPGVGHAFIEERKKAQDIEKEKGSPTNSLTKDSSPSIERKEMVDRACNLEEERKTEGVSVSSSVQVPVEVQVTREEERGSLSGGNADQDVERRDEETPMMKVVIEEKEREEAYYRRLGEDEIKTTENGEQRHDEAKQGKMVIEEERKAKDTEIALVGGDERTEEKTSFRGEDDHKCQKKDKHDSIDGHVDHTVDESIDKEVKEGISAPLQSSLLIESSQEEDPGAKSSSSPLEGGTGETSLGYLSTGEKIKEEKKKEAICPNEDQHQDDLSLLSSSKSLLQEENKSDTEGEKKKERADGFSSLVGAPGEGDQTSRGGIGSPEEKHKSVNRIEDSAPPTGLRHSMEESVSSSSSCSPGRLSPGTGSSPDQQGEDEEGVGQASKVVLPAPKTPSPSRLPLVIRADGWIDGEEEDLQHDDEEERQEEEEASRTLEREDEEEERFSGEGDDHDGDRRRFPSSSRHSLRSPRAISSSRFIEDGEDDDHNSILVTPREKKALTPLSSLSGLMRDPHHAIEDADEEDGASILPGGGIFTASSSPPSSKTHRVSKISLPSSPSPSSSFQRRDPTTGVATAGVSTTVKGGGGGGMASPTGPGVHYDRTKQRWKATWTTCEGQRASISFSVKTLGMEKARKLAFEARQQALAGKDPRDLKLGMGSGGGETGRRQKNVKSSSSVSSSRAAVVSPSRSIKKERREDTERGRKTGDKKKRLERERTKTAGQEAQGGPRVRTPRMASQKGSSGTTGAGGATPTSSLMVNTRENSSDRRTRLRKMESPLANSNDSECLEEDHEHDRGARREEEGSDLLGEGREEEERMKKNDKTTERAEDSIRRKRRVSVLSEEEGEREEAGEERVEELSHSRSSGRSREKRRRSSRRDLIHGEDHDGETVLSMKKARKKGNEEVSHRNRGHDGGRDEDIFSSSSSLSHARHHKPQVSPRDGEEEEGEEEEEDFLSMSSAVEPCVVDDGLPRHDDLPSPSPSSPPSASSLTHKHLSTPHNREDLLLPSLVHSIPASIATPDTERTSKRLTSSSSSLERSESLHLPERTSLSPSSFIDPHTSPQASSSSLTGMTFPTMTSRNPPLSLGVSSSLAVHTTAATPTTLSPSSPTRSRSLLVTSSTEKDEMKAAVSLLTPEVASSITPDSNAPPSSLSEEQASSSSSSTGDARSRRRISGRREEARASPLIIDSEETIEEGDVGRKGYLSSSSSSCPEKKRRTNEDHIDSSSSSSMSNREEGKKDVEGEGRSLSFSSGRFLRLRGVVSSPLGREERDKEEDEGDLANDNNNDDDAKEDGKATIQLDSSGMNDLKAPTIEKEEKAGGGRDMSPSSSSSS